MEDSGKELRLTILYEKEGSEWGHYMRKVCEYDQRLEKVEIFPCKIDPWLLNPDDLFQIGLAQCKLLILTEAMLEVEEHVWQELELVLQPASSVLLFFCGVWSAERLYDMMPESRNWVITDAEKDTDSIVDFIISMTSLKDEASTMSGYEEEESTYSNNASIDKNEAGEEVTAPTSAVHVEWMDDSTGVMDICHVQPMMVLPEKIWPGIEVYLLLMTRIEEETTLLLTWTSEIDETTHNSKPILVNDYTLRVVAPAIKPGQVWLCLWQEEVLLTQVVVTFTDDLHELECLLRKVTNPISFMCQAFQITPGDVNTLDKLLTDCLRENVPVGGLHLFGITHSEEEEDSSSLVESQEELPTLLHFAARFGLSNVMAQLLQYPGAFQALRTTNKHGLGPSHLAETHGFLELQQFINDYLETGTLLKEELWSSITNKGQIDANPEKKKAYEQMIRCTTDKLMRCSLHPGTDDDLPSSITRCHSPDTLLECKYVQTNVASCENDMRKYFEDEEENPYIIPVSDVLSPEEKTEHTAGIEAKEEVQEVQEVQEVEEEKEHNTKPVIFEYEFQQHCEDTNNEIYDTIEGCVIPTTEALPPSTPDFQFKPQITKQTPITDVKPQWQVDDVYGSLVMTPGQEQLIHLQEQVKLKNLTIDEALSSFKAWQNEQIKKGDSFRSQKKNLQKLRQSIARKHKDDGKKGEVEIIHVLDKSIYDSVKGVTSVPSGGLQSIYSTTPIPSNLYGQVSPKCTRGVLKSGHCTAASSTYGTNAALLNVYGTMATNRSNYCTMMNLPKINEMDTAVYSTLGTAARGNNVCLNKPQGGRGSYPRGILPPQDIKERKEEGIYNFAFAPPSTKDAATIISDAPPPVAPRPHRTLKSDKKRTIESQDLQPQLGPRPNTIAQQLPGRKKKLCPTVSEDRMNLKMLSRRPTDPPPPLPRQNQR